MARRVTIGFLLITIGVAGAVAVYKVRGKGEGSGAAGGSSGSGAVVEDINRMLERAEVNATWEETFPEALEMCREHPHDEKAWRLLGWTCAFNASRRRPDAAARYRWIRQGAEVLIEAAANLPESPFPCLDLAHVFSRKMGDRRLSEDLRPQLARDEEFQELLRQHIALEKARDPGGRPAPYLIARLWAEKAVERLEKMKSVDESINPTVVYAYPVRFQIRYAEELSRGDHPDDVVRAAWKDTQELWQSLEKRPLRLTDERAVRLDDGSRHARLARQFMKFDSWLARARLEQSPELISARRALGRAMRAARAAAEESPDAAARRELKGHFDRAFDVWKTAVDKHPVVGKMQVDIFCEDLMDGIDMYRRSVLPTRQLPADFPLHDVIASWNRPLNR